MNFIRKMLNTNGLPQLPQLGRWNLHYDPKIIHSKVDQANEDHCGCCHMPADKFKELEPQQIPTEPKERCTQDTIESEEHYIPYLM